MVYVFFIFVYEKATGGTITARNDLRYISKYENLFHEAIYYRLL